MRRKHPHVPSIVYIKYGDIIDLKNLVETCESAKTLLYDAKFVKASYSQIFFASDTDENNIKLK